MGPKTTPATQCHRFRIPGNAFRLLLFTVLYPLLACSLPPSKVSVPPPPALGTGVSQTGIASWYGPGFHGRPTASGAIYDQYELTAAHQTLPLGTSVMVTNLENGKSIEVTINDRGPFAKGRIIDLSFAAARTLGMIGPGTIPVRIEVIDSGLYRIQRIRERLDYTLQLGSFAELENAQKLRNQLIHSYPEVSIVPLHTKDLIFYRVQFGTFSNRTEAEEQARHLASRGFPVIIVEK